MTSPDSALMVLHLPLLFSNLVHAAECRFIWMHDLQMMSDRTMFHATTSQNLLKSEVYIQLVTAVMRE